MYITNLYYIGRRSRAPYHDGGIERFVGAGASGVERGERGSRSVFGRGRREAFYLLLLAAAAMSVAFLRELLPLIVLGWPPAVGAELGVHRLHVTAIAGAVATVLLGLFVQAYRPTARIPALLALVDVATVPLLAFVANRFALTPNATDPHAVDGHYVTMAAVAVAPLACGLSAALGVAGWRLAAWIPAVGPLYHGLLSVAFPAQAGVGPTWGVAAIVRALAFVLVAAHSRTVGASATFRREVVRAS
jgi:hypothetical protein